MKIWTLTALVLCMLAPFAFAEAPEAQADAEALAALQHVVPEGSNAVAIPVTAYEAVSFPMEPEFLQFPPDPSDDDGTGGGGGGGGGTGGSGQYVCSASVLCSGGGFIEDYVLTCQGRYSCSNGCDHVVCDGLGTLCFFGGANC